MPKVSIILNCHNGEDFLQETLLSIKKQTFQDFEIIFFDNDSDDGSAVIAKSFGTQLRYFKSDDFISLGAARNEALKLVNGEYIAFIDADDLWESEKLARQVKILDSNDSIGIVYTNFSTLNMLKNKKEVAKKRKDIQIGFESFVLSYSYCLSTFMIRKKCLDNIPFWFDERLHYAEEYDLFNRLAYQWNVYGIGDTLASRRIHQSMNSIKLADKIPVEHEIALQNIRGYITDFDTKYPRIVKKILYLRDYMDVKSHFLSYTNITIRKMMRQYIFLENRAMAYFLIACFPRTISVLIYNKIYTNHI